MFRVKKQVFFYGVLFLPLAFLSLWVIVFGYRIYQIDNIDKKEMVQVVHKVINRERRDRDLTQIQSVKDEFLIYIFGGSSIVLPDSCDGRNLKNVFSELLAKRFKRIDGKKVRIINLGVCGMDSTDVLNAAKRSFEMKTPDMIIVYSGHNDYNNVYHHRLVVEKISISNYKFLTDFLASYKVDKLLFSDEKKPKWSLEWFFRTNIEPPFQHLFQALRLVSYNQEDFDAYDTIILNRYKANIRNLLKLAAHFKVQVVLMTPISNLEAPPIGIDRTAANLHEKGLKEAGYKKRIDYLTEAKDMEYLSPDTRAKSPINNFIRGLREENLWIVDLEKILREQKFMFGQNDFPDYFHFSEKTHRRIAYLLGNSLEYSGAI